MKYKLIIDGNAFYEIDEECMERRKREETHPVPPAHSASCGSRQMTASSRLARCPREEQKEE